MKIKYINLFILLVATGVFVYAFFVYDNNKPIRYDEKTLDLVISILTDIYKQKHYEYKRNFR